MFTCYSSHYPSNNYHHILHCQVLLFVSCEINIVPRENHAVHTTFFSLSLSLSPNRFSAFSECPLIVPCPRLENHTVTSHFIALQRQLNSLVLLLSHPFLLFSSFSSPITIMELLLTSTLKCAKKDTVIYCHCTIPLE